MDSSNNEFLTNQGGGSFLKVANSKRQQHKYDSISDDLSRDEDDANISEESGERDGVDLRMQGMD